MRAPIHRRIDIFYSVLGCGLFIASGVFIIEAWEFSFRTRTRDLALIKASLAIVNGVLFGFDAIFTFRDKWERNTNGGRWTGAGGGGLRWCVSGIARIL